MPPIPLGPGPPPFVMTSAAVGSDEQIFGVHGQMLPVMYQREAVFVMNPHTMGLLMTMSDSNGRPIMTPTPAEGAGFLLGGSPIVVSEQMPDVETGHTPVLYANLRALYTLVTRRALTMLSDPYSAGWCTLFKFDMRAGGGVVCPGAARLLRIR